VTPFFGIGGGKEGTGDTSIERRADQPTEPPLDLAFRRECDRARPALVVGEPAVGGLREREGEGLSGVLVQLGSLFHTRLQVKRRDVLLGQRKFLAAHGGSSSKTGQVFGWSCYDAASPLELTSPMAQMGRQRGGSSSSTALFNLLTRHTCD
jgi:hypothetical protein